MNERNVDWLCAALMAANTEVGYPLRRDRSIWMGIAEALASQGVLVPGALTQDDAQAVTAHAVAQPVGVEAVELRTKTEWMRDALERIAKGEALADA